MSRLDTILALAAESPAEPMPHYMAGNELLNAGDFERAVPYLRRYVDMLPGGDIGAAYRLLGRAFLGTGDLERARRAFAEGIRAALTHGHSDLAHAIEEELADLTTSSSSDPAGSSGSSRSSAP